ncbi:hypothetical protein JCM8208_006178 [Rhodotorula glutinis]
MARSKGAKARSTPPRPAPPPSDSASSHHGDDDDDSDTFEDALPSTAQPSTPASVHTGDHDHGDLAPHADNGDRDADIEEQRAAGEGQQEGHQEHGNDERPALNGAGGPPHDDNAPSSPPADDLERAQTPTTAAAAVDTTPPRTPTSDKRPSSRPSSIASTASSSAGLDRREANRLSSSVPSSANELETDASSPTDEHEHHHHEGDDSVSELPSSTFSPAAKRPFSLSSDPETPTTPQGATTSSPPASPARQDRPKPDRRRSSLLASPFGAAPTDPTNVGREGSASLTQAVWRQSLGLNSSPAARTLVDVTLHDDEDGEDGRERALGLGASDDDEGAREGRSGATPRARRAGSSKRRSAAAVNGDEEVAAGAGGYGALSHGAAPGETRDRQASVAEPHAADGFLSNRYSVNLSSLSASSPSVPGTSSTAPNSPAPDSTAAAAAAHGEPETASNGIQRLQAEFLKVRERQEHEGDEAMAIDWDFWGRVMNDYEEVARTQPRDLSRAIQRGIPPALRGMTWQLMAAAKDANLEFVYSELLKQSSPHEKSIARDLSRTFPKHAYFVDADGVGQENLFNVVKAYSLYDDEVGYTQGLQFIVGPLLLNMPDEEAFSVLVRLMKAYDLRSHYTPNMPGLQLRLFQFDRLVEELAPTVFLHMLRQGVKSSMYASQWFLTLFGYRFPLELVSAVFDLVFAEGVEAVFRFAVSLLRRNEAHLLTLEFEDLIDFLKNGLFEVYAPYEEERARNPDAQYKVHEFVREALQVRITPMMLDQFGEEWASLCAAQTAHTAELDALRKANLQLSIQVRQLEASLAQINAEHCDLVKQVVASRLDREELEDELVKYKLAYADLSHLAAAERASTSSLQVRRQSEMSTASSRSGDENPLPAPPAPPLPPRQASGSSGGGAAAALSGIGRGWFGGSAGGTPVRRTSSNMSGGGW